MECLDIDSNLLYSCRLIFLIDEQDIVLSIGISIIYCFDNYLIKSIYNWLSSILYENLFIFLVYI